MLINTISEEEFTMSDNRPRNNHGSPDAKYGWVVVIATAIGFSLITGLARVSGFIYVLIIDNYQLTRAQASTIFITARIFSIVSMTIFFIQFHSIPAPITSKLVTKYTYSILICIGGLTLFLGLFLSSFATRLWQLAITYGACLGIGCPLVVSPGILAINTFFKAKRPLALSIYFTIGGASGLVIPFLFEILLAKYHLSGTLLIYSAIFLNICCCGLLVTQPHWSLQSQNQIKSLNEEKTSLFSKIVKEIKSDISIFKDPIFLVLLTCRILIMMPLLNIIQFIPDFVEKDLNLGLSKGNIATLLSVTAIGDICARFLAGTVFNKLPWHRKYTYAFLCASVGALLFGLLLVRSYVVLIALHVVLGLQLGILNVMQYILEADLMGSDRTPLSFGITQCLGIIASVVMMYSVGYIRDVTGSYKVGFSVMGTSAILSALFWLVEPCVVRCLPKATVNSGNKL